MVKRIIIRQELQRVPREPEAGMVIDRLDSAERKEPHPLADTQARTLEREQRADGILEEAFQGVVIERAEGAGDVEPMVADVEGAVEVGGGVHGAMDEVLPGIDEEHGE